MKKTRVDSKISIRFIAGDVDVLDYWTNVLKENSVIISESRLLDDRVNQGYQVKHFELSSHLED